MWCRVFGRGEGIRTPGPMLPKHVRYQTALHPGFPYRHPLSSGDVLYNTRCPPNCQPLFFMFFRFFCSIFSAHIRPIFCGLFRPLPS